VDRARKIRSASSAGNKPGSPWPKGNPADARILEEIVAEAERTALAQAMERYPTSRKLGSALGLSHTTVLKKIRKYALNPPKK